MAPLPIKDLIKEPFGPYPDTVILNPDWKPTGKSLPQLRQLRIQQNKQFIGLDTCERYLEPPTKPSSSVSFFGVLIIKDLEWLSEAGKLFLARDLNKRDETGQRPSQNSRRTAPNRQPLSLEGLYGKRPGEGLKIEVWLMSEKETPAMFKTAEHYPNSLLLGSKDQHRVYEILTMARETYSLSSNFLQRYRLVALINQIVAKYEIPPNTAQIDNFVNGYLLIHKENLWSYATIFAEQEQPPRQMSVEPRLRHVSHAEVRESFAAHSGWLLAFYLLKRSRPIDVRLWCEFITKVRVAKRAPKSKTWSQTYEDDEIWASDEEGTPEAIAKTLETFGGTTGNWEKRIRNAITRDVSPAGSSSDEMPMHVPSKQRRRPLLAYDSDFSEPSTPGCSDSEYDSDPPSPAFRPILFHMSQPPTLLPGRFIWDCPVPKCNYSLNLLDLERSGNNEGLPKAVVRKKQFSNLQDEQVQKFLCRTVSDHYCDHLGIKVKPHQNKEKFMAELMKGRRD